MKKLLLLLALPGLLFLAACDRHDDDDHFGVVNRVEIRDRATNALFAFYEREQHALGFQGTGVPHLHVGDEIALNVRFFDTQGQQAALGTGQEYEVRAEVVGPAGIVSVSNHGDHVDVEALAEGETYVVFHLWHGNHADFTTPQLEIEVDAHDDH
jgi:hypothetical protein